MFNLLLLAVDVIANVEPVACSFSCCLHERNSNCSADHISTFLLLT
jgi:hypothetical protein